MAEQVDENKRSEDDEDKRAARKARLERMRKRQSRDETAPAVEDDDPLNAGGAGNLQTKSMSLRQVVDEIGELHSRMQRMLRDAMQDGEPMKGAAEARWNRMNERMTSLIRLRDQQYRMIDARSKAGAAVETRTRQIANMVQRAGGSRSDIRTAVKRHDSREYRDAFTRYLVSGNDRELRVMAEGSPADGGYLPSTEFYAQLVEKRFLANAMRQVATIMPLGTFKTEMTIESTFGTADYVAENAAVTESSPQFTTITLKPYTMRYFTKVSNELIADAATRGAAFSIDTILANQIGRVMGLKEEETFVNGDGNNKPKGIFNYTSGSGTTISHVTAAATTSFTLKNLLDVVYALPRQYRTNAKWVMSDAVYALIRSLFQSTTVGANPSGIAYSPYSWSVGDGRAQDGEPDRLFGYPVHCVASAPTIAANAIALAFGDFDYYRIGEREGINIMTARETFLANNQTGYYAFARHDAQATMLDAFRYLKMAAA